MLPCPVVDAEPEYRPGPAISGAAIKQQYGITWFHFTESCNLRAKGFDADECRPDAQTEWEQIDNYIDLNATAWSGEFLDQANGDVVRWQPTDHTSEFGTVITARIDDRSNDPHADADDSYVDVQKAMFAYEAKVTMAVTGSGGTESVKVFETAYDPMQYPLISLDLDAAEVHATDAGNPKDTNGYSTTTWKLGTNPEAARLDSQGELEAGIYAHAYGTLYSEVYDDDLIDYPISIAVTPSVALDGIGVGVGVGITYPNEDDTWGAAGCGFAFDSDRLSEDTDDLLELESLDGIDWSQSREFEHQQGIPFRGGKDDMSMAKALVKGEAKVKEASGDTAWAKVSAEGRSVSAVNSFKGVTYVGARMDEVASEQGY